MGWMVLNNGPYHGHGVRVPSRPPEVVVAAKAFEVVIHSEMTARADEFDATVYVFDEDMTWVHGRVQIGKATYPANVYTFDADRTKRVLGGTGWRKPASG